MSVKSKQIERLDRLESELRSDLVRALRRVVAGTDSLFFCTDQTNPYSELKHHTSATGTELFKRATTILLLAEKLGEPKADLVAHRVVRSFEKWADSKNHHRGSATTIANELLEELDSPDC